MSIDYFNRRHPLHNLKVWAALRARKRMYQKVLDLGQVTADTRILDIGTSPDLEIPYNNFFERWYPYPERITACSVEDCSNLEREFPGLKFCLIKGNNLPFQDREFDLALSFAVLEHVGGEAHQRYFLSEVSRVAAEFVIYTPYRYFPLEMHTLQPFVHWLPARWYRALWRRLGLSFWADECNLNLLSVTAVKSLLPTLKDVAVRLVWTLGLPSNIEIHGRHD